ncbi:MAG TPA: nitrophenyl compound nitroreductase subunit ArsF family protein [Verrucomicrobiae bacterium]|nr:nitrophenyl compound nitroreductase subunit ArsF family protein [Verrucomicrobiae bacterium]
MKTNTKIVLIGAVLLAVLAMSSMKRSADSSKGAGACCPLMAALNVMPVAVGTNQVTTNAAAQQIVAYYFHGTIRCETCLKIEKQAREVIERQFKLELETQQLVFKPVNYDLPENAHFLLDYKLPCPSLVLVRQKDGKDEKWTLLNETWQLVEDPVKFDKYIETEVRNFLSGQTSTNKVELPPSPDPT